MSELRVEYAGLPDLIEYEANPKDHDLGAIWQSIRRFGFTAPLIVNDENMTLLAGHGRLHVLRQMAANGEEPPERITVDPDTGDWLVPVVRGVSLDGEDHGAYVVADNRLVELGGWDLPELSTLLTGMSDLSGTGFDGDDLDTMLGDLDGGLEFDPADGRSVRDKEVGAAGTFLQIGSYRVRLERDEYLAWERRLLEDLGNLNHSEVIAWVRDQLGL